MHDTPLKIPTGDLPPVPTIQTIASILEYLTRLCVQVESNRAEGGGMWATGPGKRLS